MYLFQIMKISTEDVTKLLTVYIRFFKHDIFQFSAKFWKIAYNSVAYRSIS